MCYLRLKDQESHVNVELLLKPVKKFEYSLCFPPYGLPRNEQNFSVISASTPCISENQGALDVVVLLVN